MCDEFMKAGTELTDIYVCTSHDNAHIDRKPNPGMLLKAMEQHMVNMKSSIMVGDKERDILAGKNAGCGKNVMFSDGLFDTNADLVVKDLRDIIHCL
jgi:D-glycero-D-manno-heptose 1,7-bisphosphate phosphatase